MRRGNLKAWVHWASKVKDVDEYKAEQALATQELLEDLATTEALLDASHREKIMYRAESNEWERLANEWRDDYDKLKGKYEPMVGVIYTAAELEVPTKEDEELAEEFIYRPHVYRFDEQPTSITIESRKAFLAGMKAARDQCAAIIERKDRKISELEQETKLLREYTGT